MAQTLGKLTTAFVKAVAHSGETRSGERYADGHGLMLCVQPSGSKSWVQRIVIHGRRRTFGLGGWPLVDLKEARRLALENRRLARQGRDPLALRVRRDVPTFAAAAAKVIALKSGAWKGDKSRQQWQSSLEAYVFPRIGAMRVDAITGPDVMSVLEKIWSTKPVTARRVRQRISAIMQWAMVHEFRTDDPAAAVLQALPPRMGAPQRHHKAVPYSEVAGTVRRVRESESWLGTRLVVEFLVLTAARSGEVRGATWDEIDLDAATWTVPADRMKARVEHRVPLAPRCLEILDEARCLADMDAPRPTGGLLFPSVRGMAQSAATLSNFMITLGVQGTPHGFRSSFRDWASEKTDAPHAVMEAALAHVVPNIAERAYARSDLFERRRALMAQWAAHVCGNPTG